MQVRRQSKRLTSGASSPLRVTAGGHRGLAAIFGGAAVAALFGGAGLQPRITRAADSEVRIRVDDPLAGQLVRNDVDLAPFSGVAIAGERHPRYDLMLVIDVSLSTQYPSGTDVDRDGEVGVTTHSATGTPIPCTDPDDSILAAEIEASLRLLDALDPERVRVGVVTFSGEIDPVTGRRRSVRQVDAELHQPLTTDHARVRRQLEAILARGPSGGTNMEAGVKLALRELAGLAGAVSAARPDAGRILLFLTDGKPSLPFGRADEMDDGDVEAALAAAQLAAQAEVTINVFGLGPGATDYPVAASGIAKLTRGLYTPVRRPGDIVAVLSGVSFADVEDVVAVNLTTQQWAEPSDVLLRPDGSFSGFVPVREGRNRIRVSALASDGTRGSTEFEIEFRGSQRGTAELSQELERVRQRNREVKLQVERGRREAFRERERQRALEVEVEKPNEEIEP